MESKRFDTVVQSVEPDGSSPGPCAAKSLLLKECGRWLSEPSLTTGLCFVVAFSDEASVCRPWNLSALKSLKVDPDNFNFNMVAFDLVQLDHYLQQAQTGLSAGSWQRPAWVAFVADTSNVIKAVFVGSSSGKVAYIGYIESTMQDPVRGAVSWGFSMLLHRLKLQSFETATLTDAS